MRQRGVYKRYLEIGPATMLLGPLGSSPTAAAGPNDQNQIPDGAWLLVLPGKQTRIYQGLLDLAKRLKAKGERVILSPALS